MTMNKRDKMKQMLHQRGMIERGVPPVPQHKHGPGLADLSRLAQVP